MAYLALALAAFCSLVLTALTVLPPAAPTDWARLNADRIYIPQGIDYRWPSYIVQVALWAGIVAALWVACNPHPPAPSPSGREREGTARRWSVVGLVTLLGFGLRVHTLTALPLIVDEIGFAARASDIFHGEQVPIFAPGHNANPSVYSWLVAGMMGLFGQNTFAIRLLPLFFGTLSIPAIYLLGRVWWSGRIGMLAAAFLATYPAHVFYSRMSLYNIVDPVFAMLALAFLAQAMWRHARRDYMLAGMMGALAQYFYHGSRLLLVLMGLLAVGCWLLAKEQEIQRKGAKGQRREEILIGLLWMVAAFGLLALPRFAPAVAGGLPLEGNREAMRLPADFFPDNTARALLAWVGQPDVSPFWLSEAPLLPWPAMLLFAAGLVCCLRQLRDVRCAVLVAAVVLTSILGGAIWTAAPLYVRYMTAVPAVALLVALGLSAISRQLSAISRYASWLGAGVMVLVFVYGVMVAWQHPAEAQARITASQRQADALAQEAAGLPENTSVMLVVPENFGEADMITIADYIAAYGRRRAIAVNRGQPARLEQQKGELSPPVTVLTAMR